MKKHTTVFIAATAVTRGPLVGDPYNRETVLLCIDVLILKSFIDLQGSEPPPEVIDTYFSDGPILWNDEMKQLTFSCLYWRCDTREWKTAKFRSTENSEPFFDGSDAYCLMGKSDTDSDVLRLDSIPLSLQAMSKLAKQAKSKKHFVMATTEGVVTFSELESFECHFRNSLGKLKVKSKASEVDLSLRLVHPSSDVPSTRHPWH